MNGSIILKILISCESQQGEKNVDIICDRFLFFCGNHNDTCKVWNPKNRFGCGNGDSNDCCVTVFLAHGICDWHRDGNHADQWENAAVSDFVRSGYGCFLDLLISRIAKR